MKTTVTIIAIDYGMFEENAVVTAENIEEIRDHISDKKWRYVIEGEIKLEASSKEMKQYFRLITQEDKARENASRYESGLDYDPIKRDSWIARADKYVSQQHEIESRMTDLQKESVMIKTGIEIC